MRGPRDPVPTGRPTTPPHAVAYRNLNQWPPRPPRATMAHIHHRTRRRPMSAVLCRRVRL
jgi:hypothetical protein